jgi:hypothetical protein
LEVVPPIGKDDRRDGCVLVEPENLSGWIRVLVAPPPPLEIGRLPKSAERIELSRSLQEPADEVEIRAARCPADVQ